MENFVNQFAFIKVLKGHGEAGLFYEGMQNNYNLEKGSDYEKYIIGASWVEMEPKTINELPTGSLFIGVTKSESAAREYIVIGKDSSGNSIWYPINGPESAEPVVVIWEFNPGAKTFDRVFKSEISSMAIKIKELCKPGRFYISTDVNGYLIPAFGVFNQPDDDDWADDDDDDEDMRDEDKEVLKALSDITSDEGDDDDEDDEDFDQTDCLFTILNIDGKVIAMTVSHGISLDEESDENEHMLQHAIEDLKSAERRVERLRNDVHEIDEMNEQFTAAYSRFLEDSKNIVIGEGIQTVNNIAPVDDDVPVADLSKFRAIEDPDDSVDEIEQPAAKVVIDETDDEPLTEADIIKGVNEIGEIAKQGKPVEMTEDEAKINKQLAEAMGLPESETNVKIKLPKNSDDFEVKETPITRAYKEQMKQAEAQKVDTDGEENLDIKPTNYDDSSADQKANHDFGDW